MAEIALSAGPSRAGPWSLVIPAGMYERLRQHLFPGDGDEHGAVIAAGMATGTDGAVRLLSRDLFLAADGQDYVPGQRGYRMLTAEFIRKRIKYCRDQKLVYLAIHNHGGHNSVCFSGDDLRSHERGYPALLDITGSLPVGALVFAPDAVAADIWLPGGARTPITHATIVGASRRVLRSAPVSETFARHAKYDRQARLFGDAGQAILGRAKIAIIGLGGVGSIIAELSAHLGVGKFVLIDPDRFELTNHPRVVGATRWDALPCLLRPVLPVWARRGMSSFATRKTLIAARVIRRPNPDARINIINRNVADPEAARALLDCDYIFLAADTATARLIFNQVVNQYLIPGVQIGSKISTDKETGDISNVFSIVRPASSEHGCLWCNELINPAHLQEEAQQEEERRAQRYLDEDEVPTPSVITLNAVGAAHAANDFLFYMTGLTSPDAARSYQLHLPAERRTVMNIPRRDSHCPECGSGFTSRRAQGDACSLTTRA